MNDKPLPAPQCASDAAEQLHILQQDLEIARAYARQYGTAADRAEHLYRREQSKAWMHVEGRNAEERGAAVHEWPLRDVALEDSAAVSEAMGLDGAPCRTVGELRWLRDRAQRLADQWSATAYDRRNRVSAWMTVASMAKTEAELGGAVPEHGPRAVAS